VKDRLDTVEYDAVTPPGEVETAVTLLHDVVLQRRRELEAADAPHPDRDVAAEVRQQVRKWSPLAAIFRLTA
jgi:hypothetical protein